METDIWIRSRASVAEMLSSQKQVIFVERKKKSLRGVREMLSASQGVSAARQQFNCVPPRRSTFKGTPKCTKALRGEQHKWLDLKAAPPPLSLSLFLSSQVALHVELERLSDIL